MLENLEVVLRPYDQAGKEKGKEGERTGRREDRKERGQEGEREGMKEKRKRGRLVVGGGGGWKKIRRGNPPLSRMNRVALNGHV
jgi:hypothetical protein